MGHYLALVAQWAHPRAAADESVVQEELAECYQGNAQVEGQVELLVELINDSVEVGKCHGQLAGVNCRVGSKHPLPNDRASHEQKREDADREGTELLAKPLDSGRVVLQEGAIGDVPAEKVDESKWNERGNTYAE